MRARSFASLAASGALAATMALPAQAQVLLPPAKTVVPVVLWGVIGAVAWAMMFPGAAPLASMTVACTWGSFLTTRAAVGTVLGGALGYAIAPS